MRSRTSLAIRRLYRTRSRRGDSAGRRSRPACRHGPRWSPDRGSPAPRSTASSLGPLRRRRTGATTRRGRTRGFRPRYRGRSHAGPPSSGGPAPLGLGDRERDRPDELLERSREPLVSWHARLRRWRGSSRSRLPVRPRPASGSVRAAPRAERSRRPRSNVRRSITDCVPARRSNARSACLSSGRSSCSDWSRSATLTSTSTSMVASLNRYRAGVSPSSSRIGAPSPRCPS